MFQELPGRIRELRRARHSTWKSLGVERTSLCRVETDARGISLGYLNRIAASLDTSVWRFFLREVDFARLMLLEDDLVIVVLPFLRLLNAGQNAQILQTGEAAPQQKAWTGRGAHSERTERVTSNESKRFIANRASAIQCL